LMLPVLILSCRNSSIAAAGQACATAVFSTMEPFQV
jgi:hypothetical protein